MRAAALLALALVAGCSSPGSFPSLARRAVEERPVPRVDDPEPPLPSAPAAADVRSRAAALLAEGRAGAERFAPEINAARDLAARAGATGGDAWAAAQQALSRAEAARAPLTVALAELDRLRLAEAANPRPSAGANLLVIAEVVNQLGALADTQARAIAEVRRTLDR